jgi:predicted DNA-binding protein
MPNQPKTPTRAFRIPDEVYSVIVEISQQKGVTVTAVIREALETYIENALWKDEPGGK